MNEPRRAFADRSLVQLTLLRFREYIREPEALFWAFVFPILLSAGLGIAFRNRPAEVLRIATPDAALASTMRHEKGLAVEVHDRDAGETALRTGRILLYAYRNAGGAIVYRYDDTNAEARTARLLAERAATSNTAAGKPPNASDEIVREAGSRYIDFVVPGLIGMNIMGSGVWSIGFAIVDARRKKLLKRLVASPMKRWEYLLSFLLSRLGLLVVEVLVLVAFALAIFGVPFRGSKLDFAIICVIASCSFSALGLLIASRARTIEAVSGLMNFMMVPMWMLSGIFFSADRFPDAVQPFIRSLPLTAAIDALRGNMLQATPLTQLGRECAVLAGWLVVSFFLALRLFRWR